MPPHLSAAQVLHALEENPTETGLSRLVDPSLYFTWNRCFDDLDSCATALVECSDGLLILYADTVRTEEGWEHFELERSLLVTPIPPDWVARRQAYFQVRNALEDCLLKVPDTWRVAATGELA